MNEHSKSQPMGSLGTHRYAVV